MKDLQSRDRAQINRENAKKSTGPKTQAGKDRVRFNATRHGLTGQVVVLPTDDLVAYQKHSQEMLASLAPQGALETQLAQTISDTLWQMNRSHAYHDQILAMGALRLLERWEEQPGEINPQLSEAFAVAATAAKVTRDLANLSLCQHRAYRTFEKAHDRLRMLQEERRQKEAAQMADAKALLALHEEEEEEKREAREEEAEIAARTGAPSPAPYVPVPFDPKEFGFGLQVSEIKAHRDRYERLFQASLLLRESSAAA